MKKRLVSIVSVLLTIILSTCSFGASKYTNYPTRPIKFVVPYGAGGNADITVRALLKFSDLGKPGVVINMPGGGGNIGAMEVYNSKPDGYTLLHLTPAGMLISELNGQLPAGITKDMIPICLQAIDMSTFCVPKSAQYKTAQEFFNYAKTNPGKVSVASSGMSAMYINALSLMDSVGLKLNYVSFDGASKSRPAVVGGHVDTLICLISESLALVQSGDLIPLFVYGTERSPYLPEVPSLKELGYDVPGCPSLRGLWAPKDTPQEIVDKLEGVFLKALNNPQYKKTLLEDVKMTPVAWNSAETRRWVEKNKFYYKKLLDKYGKK